MNVGDPVAHRLVERILERLRAGLDRYHRGAKQLHAVDVGCLALDVLAAHINHAVHAVAGGHRRRRHAMLAGAGFGDDARLAHAPGEHGLADAVVHLVGAGMVQILALEVDLRATKHFGPAFGMVDRRRPPNEMFQLVFVLGAKSLVSLRFGIGGLEFVERREQRLGDENTAVGTEMAPGVGEVIVIHQRSVQPPRRQRFSSDP